MIHCYVCKKENAEGCDNCFQTAIGMGTLEIVWNGFVAMRADCSVCENCDGAWLHLSSRAIYICNVCRHRELHVRISPGETHESARAMVGGA